MSTTISKRPDESFPRVEVITSEHRRRRWSVVETGRLVEEAPMQPGISVSCAARRPAFLRPSSLPGSAACGASQVRDLEKRVRDLERMLGKKTIEVDILSVALDLARPKKRTSPLLSVAPAIQRAVVLTVIRLMYGPSRS